ncbi:hypothetical protein ACGFZK_01450 [Streptomyces sp. NPDC048257]|uniref:hypothetical protein n=1 Tax=Streptomyces sp. NPDC048257 TaxID=3365526 RepID=UPI003713164C
MGDIDDALDRADRPTVQSIRIDGGVVHPHRRSFRSDAHGDLVRDEHGVPVWWDRQGDGTVYRDAASNGATQPVPVPLQHGAPAKDPHALAYVLGVLTEHEPQVSPPMARSARRAWVWLYSAHAVRVALTDWPPSAPRRHGQSLG